mmetsp:Transcript_2706/g.9853  ORF Transcript_2706/g.9853 Transcript_2706/m.9853 type:complete len:353 (+) Transcript_2706:70-1128(+)
MAATRNEFGPRGGSPAFGGVSEPMLDWLAAPPPKPSLGPSPAPGFGGPPALKLDRDAVYEAWWSECETGGWNGEGDMVVPQQLGDRTPSFDEAMFGSAGAGRDPRPLGGGGGGGGPAPHPELQHSLYSPQQQNHDRHQYHQHHQHDFMMNRQPYHDLQHHQQMRNFPTSFGGPPPPPPDFHLAQEQWGPPGAHMPGQLQQQQQQQHLKAERIPRTPSQHTPESADDMTTTSEDNSSEYDPRRSVTGQSKSPQRQRSRPIRASALAAAAATAAVIASEGHVEGAAPAPDAWRPMRSMKELLASDGADLTRQERVARFKEKRRTRLFTKRIRYQVRKKNAESRPRFKGRFVKTD